MALALTLRASKTDFSLPRPTLQAIRPVTGKGREPSRRNPQTAVFSHAVPAAGMSGALRGEVAAMGLLQQTGPADELRSPKAPRLARSSRVGGLRA